MYYGFIVLGCIMAVETILQTPHYLFSITSVSPLLIFQWSNITFLLLIFIISPSLYQLTIVFPFPPNFYVPISKQADVIYEYTEQFYKLLLFQNSSLLYILPTVFGSLVTLKVDTRMGKNVRRLTSILSWDTTTCRLFFSIVPLAVHTLLPVVMQCFREQ